MQQHLILTDRPHKAKALKNTLGAGWQVITFEQPPCDLPLDELGVDVHKDFSPQYHIHQDAHAPLRQLKRGLAQASALYVATQNNPDGEGLAYLALKLLDDPLDMPIRRLRLKDFTAKTIQTALAQSTPLNRAWIEAQQARRILDRLIAFLVAPAIGKFRDDSYYLTRGVMWALGVMRLRHGKLHTWDELRWSLQEAGCSHRATLEQSIFLLKREGYVQETDGVLTLNDTSAAIYDLLSQHLPIMCSPAYHRRLEGGLAQVAAGKYSSQQFLNTFWQHFRPKLTALNLAAQAHASLPRMVQPLLLDLVAEDHHDQTTR